MIKLRPFLLPRFKYTYNVDDFFYSLGHFTYSESNAPLVAYFNNKDIFFTNFARTGLRILLSSLGLKKNARIGVQAYNCDTVFKAIKIAGYRPVFLDINYNFTLDLNDLKKKITYLDALILNHTFGIPADIGSLKKIIPDIPVIEDCAHSLFSFYNYNPTGTFFDASIFSYGYGKYPCIERNGGFVVLNNKKYLGGLLRNLNRLPANNYFSEIKNISKNFIWSLLFQRPFYGLISYPFGKEIDTKYDFVEKNNSHEFKAYASNVNILSKGFSTFEKNNKKQRINGKSLYELIKNQVSCINDTYNKKINYYIFPILVDNRDQIFLSLMDRNIETGKHFSNALAWAENYGYQRKTCPTTESIVKKILTLPIHYSLTQKQIHYIASQFLEVIT